MSTKKILILFAAVLTAAFATTAALSLFAAPPFPFADLWLSTDQQAQRHFKYGNYQQAASLFTDPLRRGLSHYAAEEFDAAATQFLQLETAEAYFNLGNAYCHLERIPEAIQAYAQALARQPDYPDAQFNLEFARLLLPPKRPDDAPDDHASFDADDIRFDNTENKGLEEDVDMTEFSDDQIDDLWMRRVQTTPADFLRVRFQYDQYQKEQ